MIMNELIGMVIFKVGTEDLVDYLPEVLIIFVVSDKCGVVGLKQGL